MAEPTRPPRFAPQPTAPAARRTTPASVAGLALLALLLLPAASPADSFASLDEARELADRAMSFVREEKFAEAYAVLKPYWPLPGVEIDNMANQTHTQWPMVKQRFGASLGTERIAERQAGESLVQIVYLHKFERHALRWVFLFYKPVDRWMINSVAYDDSIASLFD